jgi:hypothetical protein
MKSTRGLLTIGKWHFKLGIIPVSFANHGYMFHFGIFKLLKFPSEGAIFVKTDYKGFWLRKTIEWRGFELSLYLDYWQRFINFVFWKKVEEGGLRQPSKFHDLLYSIFGRYFNPK